MELNYALLANNAEVGAGGRIHIFGAHIDTIRSSHYPATTGFTFVARLLVPAEEYNQRHQFRIELSPPGGERRPLMTKDQEFLTIQGAFRPDRGTGMNLIVQVPQVELDAPGDYSVHLVVDGEEIGEVPFYARQVEPEGLR